MEKIALFGGTFDPIHNGHIGIIENLKTRFDRVTVIPNRIPPHKSCGSSPNDRLDMLKAAVGDLVDTVELDSSEVSYTYLTLQKYQGRGDLYLVIGADSLLGFTEWKNPDIIAKLCTLYVIPRPLTLGLEQVAQYIRIMYGARVEIADFVGEDVSSTEIRVRAAFEDFDKVPQAVAAIISKRGLYSDLKRFADGLKLFNLSDNRIRHTLNVAIESIRLAAIYKVDTYKAAVAAILHDIAKNLSIDTAKETGLLTDSQYKELNQSPPAIRHAFLSAKVAHLQYCVTDTEILDAIRFHTTARPNMSQLEKVVFLADYIEPMRDFDGVERIRELAYCDLDRALIAALANTLAHLRTEGKEIFSLSAEAYNYYLTEE